MAEIAKVVAVTAQNSEWTYETHGRFIYSLIHPKYASQSVLQFTNNSPNTVKLLEIQAYVGVGNAGDKYNKNGKNVAYGDGSEMKWQITAVKGTDPTIYESNVEQGIDQLVASYNPTDRTIYDEQTLYPKVEDLTDLRKFRFTSPIYVKHRETVKMYCPYFDPSEGNTGVFLWDSLRINYVYEQVTIKFDTQAPQSEIRTPDPQVKVPGLTYGTLPSLNRPNYTFDGWYTSDGVKVESSTVVPSTDMTLVAHWTRLDVTITYDAQGGSPAPQSEIKTPGTTYSSLPVVSKPDYNFKGWYTQLRGKGTKITEDTIVPSQDVTLHAYWAQIVRLTLSGNGGNIYIPPRPDEESGRTASEIQFELERNDTFEIPCNYVVTYTASSASDDHESGGDDHESGGDDPTILKIFKGWATNQDGTGTVYQPGAQLTNVNKSITLYATWEDKKFTVTFDANGGQFSDGSTQVSYSLNYGESVNDQLLPTPPKKLGTNFLKWSGSYENVTSDRTLYAMWSGGGSPIWVMTRTGWIPYQPKANE